MVKYRKKLLAILGCGNLMDGKFGPAAVQVLSDMGPNEWENISVLVGDHIPIGEFGPYIEDRFRHASAKTLKLPAWPYFRTTKCYQTTPDSPGEQAMFAEVMKFLTATDGEVIFYLALPYRQIPHAFNRIVRNLIGKGVGRRIRVVAEKPLALTDRALDWIDSLRGEIAMPEQNFGITEHFLAKPFFRLLLDPDSELGQLMRRVCDMNPTQFRILIKEKVGTCGRAYPGVMGDSVGNHCAASQCPILSYMYGLSGQLRDPLRRPNHFADMMCKLKAASRNMTGLYMCCKSDHGQPDECGRPRHVPTVVHLRWEMQLPSGRDVEMILQHAKNSDEKTTGAHLEGQGWSLDLQFDGFKNGERGYGWTFRNGAEVQERFFELRPEEACGYPSVVRWALNGDMHEFMTPRFQRCSNGLYMRAAAQLDARHNEEQRVWFDEGKDPFHLLQTKEHIKISLA